MRSRLKKEINTVTTKGVPRFPVENFLRKRGWSKKPGSLRHRIWSSMFRTRSFFYVLIMNLVGREWGGSYCVPKAKPLYFLDEGYHHYREVHSFQAMEGDWYTGEWRGFDVQNDGFEIHIGYVNGDSGNINGFQLSRVELAIFIRWLIIDYWIKGEWFGIRRWLYYWALHNHVQRFQKRNLKKVEVSNL